MNCMPKNRFPGKITGYSNPAQVGIANWKPCAKQMIIALTTRGLYPGFTRKMAWSDNGPRSKRKKIILAPALPFVVKDVFKIYFE